MSKLNFFRHYIDSIGSSLSMLCLIHCLLLPVLLATMPFFAFMSFMKSPLTEFIMASLAIANSIYATCYGYKKHKNYLVPTFLISGALLLIFHLLFNNVAFANNSIIPGVILIGFGHLINKKLCSTCDKCKITHE